MSRFLSRLEQRGDTLIEVLLAMSIISLVLVAAYITTNKNSATLQDNQEREQAQRLVEGQTEMLRANTGVINSGECFNAGNETGTCNNFSVAGSGATYTLKINGPTGLGNPSGTYTIVATWSSLHATSANSSSVTMYYRLQ